MTIRIPKNELNEFSLPRVCVTTGQQGAVSFHPVQFQYVPKWIAVFAIAPVLYLIFFFLFRHMAKGALPFSEEGWAKVKAARRNAGIAGAIWFVSLVLCGVLLGSGLDFAGILLLPVFVIGIIVVVIFSMQVRKVYPVPTLIDAEFITLKLPSAEAERAFQTHLRTGV